MFPKLSDAKLKAGVFTGPQIREMLKSQELEKRMSGLERIAWIAFSKWIFEKKKKLKLYRSCGLFN
jgi:hypothetical protein